MEYSFKMEIIQIRPFLFHPDRLKLTFQFDRSVENLFSNAGRALPTGCVNLGGGVIRGVRGQLVSVVYAVDRLMKGS